MKKMSLALTAIIFIALITSCTADKIEETTKNQTKSINKQEVKDNQTMGGEHGTPGSTK